MVVPSQAAVLAQRLGGWLADRGWTLGGAESCTGGLVSHYLTEVGGSSAYFVGAVVAYANHVKQALLSVPEATLAAHGAVSAEVALAMALGARQALGVGVAYAVTGIAGPTGGTPGKPVGTVFIAVSSPLGDAVERHVWASDRRGNKQRSAVAVLELLARQVGA
ncbi:MAG: CinA family protein [Chloroflexota bacterium]